MGFELGRLVREAAGGLGARVAAAARQLQERAWAEAGRVWRGVGERLPLAISVEIGGPRHPEPCPGELEPNRPVGPRTRAIVETMAEALSLSGYSMVHADSSGRPAPEVVRGTMRSHRPSLAAVGGGRPVLFDVYVPGETDPAEQFSRWQLFASAAAQAGGEFHVVVPARLEGSTGRDWVRRLADGTGLRVGKVWEM
jgi:hypothetical protein